MEDLWFLIFALALGTFLIRLSGFLLSRALPRRGAIIEGLNALPGCLITALLTVILIQGGFQEWIAGGAALLTAIFTRSLPFTMLAGIATIWLLRNMALL